MPPIRVLLDSNRLNTTIRRLDQTNSNAPRCKIEVDKQVIVFPMPSNLVSTISPQWEGMDLTALENASFEYLKGGSASDTLSNYGKSAIDAIASLQKNAGTGDGDASMVGVGIAAAAIGDVKKVLHADKKVLNPMKEVAFNGLSFRTFDLTFEIIAKSLEESDNLAEAIKIIQKAAVPGGGKDTLFLSYPSTFTINFLPTEDYLPTFLPCVCTSISVDYAGNAGRPRFRENFSPIAVTLSTSWMETQILTRNVIEDGHWG